jgi:EpsI family protein
VPLNTATERTASTGPARVAVVATMLVALAAWAHLRPIEAVAIAPHFASMIPFAFTDWAGRDAPALDPEVARVLAADQYVHRFYGLRRTAFADRVEMDIAYYERPQAGAAMHSPLNCLPGNGWQVVESRTAPVRAGAHTWDVRRLVVERKGHRIAMAYWFQHRGGVVGHELRQRLNLLTNGLQGRATDAALVRVMALDTDRGRHALEEFTPTAIDAIAAAFRVQ